jgi:glycosyltransferase involved in cell wall biosynthesis
MNKNILTNKTQESIRILFVAHEFTKSGAPLVLLEVISALRDQNYECHLVGPIGGALEKDFEELNIDRHSIKAINYLYKGGRGRFGQFLYLPIRLIINFYLVFQFLSLFRSIKPQIIHLNSFAARFAAIPALFYKSKVIWHLLEYYKWNPILHKLATLFVSKVADVILVVSSATLLWWTKSRNPRYRVLYGGTKVRSISDHKCRPYDIVFVGRFSYEKGFFVLLDALSMMQSIGIEPRMIAVGTCESDETQSLIFKFLESKNLAHTIDWKYDAPDAIQYIAQAKILVLPSLREGLPRVILEAMSVGTTVVATNVGGIPEVINSSEVGMLVQPSNVEQLFQAIVYLLQNENDRIEKSIVAHRLLEHHFTLEIFQENVRQLYAQLRQLLHEHQLSRHYFIGN